MEANQILDIDMASGIAKYNAGTSETIDTFEWFF